MNQIPYEPHDVVWTQEKAARFWKERSSHRTEKDVYFSFEVGSDILLQAKKTIGTFGKTLDFGCGPGFLLEKLVGQGVHASGVDFDEDALNETRKRVDGSPCFEGVELIKNVPTHLPANQYDTIFFIETIEHIMPDRLDATFAELLRLLKPGGHLVVTTPNNEDLRKKQMFCPDCGARFHRMQHVNSFTAARLGTLLEQNGFTRVVSTETFFLSNSPLNPLRRLKQALFKPNMPHLLAIAEKPVA